MQDITIHASILGNSVKSSEFAAGYLHKEFDFDGHAKVIFTPIVLMTVYNPAVTIGAAAQIAVRVSGRK